MKKRKSGERIFLPLLLAALLVTGLAGCGAGEAEKQIIATATEMEAPETTVPAASTAPTVLPTETETTEVYYPEHIADAILIEGEPEKLMMELFDGGNYVVYIIEDMWTLETSLEDGYLRDRWVCSFNDMIDFQVISFGPLPPEQAAAYIREKKSSYKFAEDDPLCISGSDMQRSYFMNGEIHSDARNTFAVITEFPMEAGDGFGGRTRKMMKSFAIK